MFWPIAEAKAKFSEMMKLVDGGEPVVITNHGHPVARVFPAAMGSEVTQRLIQVREWLGNPPVSRMAELLGLEKPGDFGRFLDGSTEAPFSFLEQFAARFHCEPEWLKHGVSKDYPWAGIACSYMGFDSAIGQIEALAPKKIIFARIDHRGRSADEDHGEAGLILQWDDWSYQVFGQQVHVSDHVGTTGMGQLWVLCRLAKELQKGAKWSVSGVEMPSDLFRDVFGHRKWAGLVEKCSRSTWWDDLTDYAHDERYVVYAGKDGANYGKNFGESFLNAQRTLRLFEGWAVGERKTLNAFED